MPSCGPGASAGRFHAGSRAEDRAHAEVHPRRSAGDHQGVAREVQEEEEEGCLHSKEEDEGAPLSTRRNQGAGASCFTCTFCCIGSSNRASRCIGSSNRASRCIGSSNRASRCIGFSTGTSLSVRLSRIVCASLSSVRAAPCPRGCGVPAAGLDSPPGLSPHRRPGARYLGQEGGVVELGVKRSKFIVFVSAQIQTTRHPAR